MKRKPEIAYMWVNPYTNEYHFVYEPPMPNTARAFLVFLAIMIVPLVLS